MLKAVIKSRYAVQVINYEAEQQRLKSQYEMSLEKNGVTDEIINPILKKKDDKRTIEELQLIVIRKGLEDEYAAFLKELELFKEYIPSEFNGEKTELDSIRPYYVEEGETVLQKWEVVQNDRSVVNARIQALKNDLEGSDYKVMKCYESLITKAENMPYDADELVKERQAKRDEINRLEGLLKGSAETATTAYATPKR